MAYTYLHVARCGPLLQELLRALPLHGRTSRGFHGTIRDSPLLWHLPLWWPLPIDLAITMNNFPNRSKYRTGCFAFISKLASRETLPCYCRLASMRIFEFDGDWFERGYNDHSQIKLLAENFTAIYGISHTSFKKRLPAPKEVIDCFNAIFN